MTARRSHWLFVLVPALLLSGCGKGSDAPRGKVRTESVDGVTLVHNPPEPLNPRKAVGFRGDPDSGVRVLTRYRVVWE
jgi:hypothetical protein